MDKIEEFIEETRSTGENIKKFIMDLIIKSGGMLGYEEVMEMTTSDISLFIKQFNKDFKTKNNIDEYTHE